MISKMKIYAFLAILLISMLLLPSAVCSQGKAYRIGPNDVIQIIIYAGGEKQIESTLTVSAQGTVNAPFIGPIKADGFTPSELEARFSEPLTKDYFVDPKVNVEIVQYRSLHYYISGAVKSPGLYEMTTEASLMVLIAKAGGVLPERGNLAYVLRDSTDAVMAGEKVENLATHKEPLKIDLIRLLDQGDMTVNPMLRPGDVVYVPLKQALDLSESKVYLEGEVKNPGAYDYQPGLTALNACIMAGGFNTFAAPNRTQIIRKVNEKMEIIKINLNHVKEGKIRDVSLKPGDRIHVPETWL
jgi:polysaccharide biosynthesis/export protein